MIKLESYTYSTLTDSNMKLGIILAFLPNYSRNLDRRTLS